MLSYSHQGKLGERFMRFQSFKIAFSDSCDPDVKHDLGLVNFKFDKDDRKLGKHIFLKETQKNPRLKSRRFASECLIIARLINEVTMKVDWRFIDKNNFPVQEIEDFIEKSTARCLPIDFSQEGGELGDIKKEMKKKLQRIILEAAGLREKSKDNLSSKKPEPIENKIYEVIELREKPKDVLSSKKLKPIEIKDCSQDSFEIIEELGRNHSAGRITYKAKQSETGLIVVIKEFTFVYGSWGGYNQIEKEIQTLSKLNHPNIPKYLGKYEFEKSLFLVQEYIEAPSLTTYGKLSLDEVKEIALLILDLLIYLQSLNPPVIHRDLKPENILLTPNGEIYLVDFGLARTGVGTVGASTMLGGTPGFAPPEQLFGKRLGLSSDLYSAGITLICLISGIRTAEIEQFINEDLEVDFAKILPKNASWELRDWLKKMVAAKPSQRFKNALQAKNSLENVNLERELTSQKTESSREFRSWLKQKVNSKPSLQFIKISQVKKLLADINLEIKLIFQNTRLKPVNNLIATVQEKGKYLGKNSLNILVILVFWGIFIFVLNELAIPQAPMRACSEGGIVAEITNWLSSLFSLLYSEPSEEAIDVTLGNPACQFIGLGTVALVSAFIGYVYYQLNHQPRPGAWLFDLIMGFLVVVTASLSLIDRIISWN